MEEIIQCMLLILCSAILVEVAHYFYKYYLTYKARIQLKSDQASAASSNDANTAQTPAISLSNSSLPLQPFQNTQSKL